MASPFSIHHKKEFLSDYKLVLLSTDVEIPKNNELPDDSRETFVHGFLLMAKSVYFRTKLETNVGRCSSSVAAVENGKPRLYLQLEAHLWDACDHVLYHMYHEALPEGLSRSEVLLISKVADLLGVDSCLHSCVQLLSAAAVDDLSWDDISAFYSSEEAFRNGALAAAGTKFRQKLMTTFLDFEAAWRDDESREVFLALPLGAVVELAAADELQVVSENTVATALARWLGAQAAAARKKLQLQEKEDDQGLDLQMAAAMQPLASALLPHLRLPHLTASYVGEVLLSLEHLGQHITPQQLAAAMQYATAPAATHTAIAAYKAMKPPRPAPRTQQITFDCSIPLADVVQLITVQLQHGTEGTLLTSGVQQFNGYAFNLCIKASNNKKGVPCLFVRLKVTTDIGSAQQKWVRSVHVEGFVSMPGEQQGQRNSFQLVPTNHGWHNCRFLQLGEGAVHDAATLVAALTRQHRTVAKVSSPAPAERVQQLQQLLLSCTITQCI